MSKNINQKYIDEILEQENFVKVIQIAKNDSFNIFAVACDYNDKYHSIRPVLYFTNKIITGCITDSDYLIPLSKFIKESKILIKHRLIVILYTDNLFMIFENCNGG